MSTPNEVIVDGNKIQWSPTGRIRFEINGELRFVPFSKRNLESVKDYFTPHTVDPDRVYVFFNLSFERDYIEVYEYARFEEDFIISCKDGKKLLFRDHSGATVTMAKSEVGILEAGQRYTIDEFGHIEFFEMITPENRFTVYDHPVISVYPVKVKLDS